MHQTPAVAPRSLSYIARQLAKSIKLVILTGVIGALVGAVMSPFVHPRWVARMTVQIGQISAPQGEGSVLSRPVENQLTAVDRYNLPALHLRVLSDLGLSAPENGDRASTLIFDSLLAAPARSADLIQLQVSAYSRAQATAALLASFKALSADQQKMFGPAVNDMKQQLADASAKLAEAERDYQSIQSSTGEGNSGAPDSRNVLATNMATLINKQILDLRQQIAALQQSLSPLLTYPTRIVEAPYVPVRPSTPSTAMLIAIGAVLGLLLGVALAVHRIVRRS